MSGFPWEAVVLSLVLLGNRVALRLSHRRVAIFWSIQAINLGCIGYVLGVGIGGMEDHAIVNWVVAALLVFHIAQNFSLRSRSRLADEMEENLKERVRGYRSHGDKP